MSAMPTKGEFMRSNSAFDAERSVEVASLYHQLRHHAVLDGAFEGRQILNGHAATIEHVFELAAKRTETLELRSVEEAEIIVMLSYIVIFTDTLHEVFSETADEVEKSYVSLRDGAKLSAWLSTETNGQKESEPRHD